MYGLRVFGNFGTVIAIYSGSLTTHDNYPFTRFKVHKFTVHVGVKKTWPFLPILPLRDLVA